MAYKRYFYRNGKKFGPYYYESYRDNAGKVRKKYVGTTNPNQIILKPEKQRKLITPTNLSLFGIAFIVVLMLISLAYDQAITGKITFTQEENLVIKLQKGELLPINSKLIIQQQETTTEFLLSDLINSNAEGNFYIKNSELTGEGAGYGEKGEKTIYPTINFQFKLISEDSSETTNETTEPEETTEADESTENITESVEETTESEEAAEEPEETDESEETTNSETTETPSESASPNPLTGSVIYEEELSGSVSAENLFTYNIENSNVEIISVDKGSISDLNIQKENGILTITTNYSETEKGFGQDFLLDDTVSIELNLEDLGINNEFSASLVYGDFILDQITTIEETPENETQELLELTNQTEENLSVQTKHYKAVINKPVKWIKTVKINKAQAQEGNLTVELPKLAENITIKTGEEAQEALQEMQQYEGVIENTGREELASMTGDVSLEIEKRRGILIKIWRVLIKISLTGNVIQEQDIAEEITKTSENKELSLDEIIDPTQEEQEIAIEYYTEGPTSEETPISRGKQIIISSSDEVHYEDVLAYTLLDNAIPVEKENKIKLYNIVDNNKEQVDFTAYDLDEDGFVDYVEWIVPSLSQQIYEIIYITKAEHLDESKAFISDIYNEVSELDNIWSETINENEYVRVAFEKNLTNENDITLYPRVVSGTPKIEVYVENSEEAIAEFSEIIEGYNKVLLTNLSQEQDVFDLKIVEGAIEFDYIIDPTIIINASQVYAGDLVNVTAETNFSHLTINDLSTNAPYDNLIAYYSFDGDIENTLLTPVYDFSKNNYNGLLMANAIINNTDCVFGDCLIMTGDNYVGDDDGVDLDPSFTISGNSSIAFSVWIKPESGQYSSGDARIIDGDLDECLLRFGNDINDAEFILNTFDAGVDRISSGASSITTGAWNHVVGQYDNLTNNMSIWVNGIIKGEVTPAGTYGTCDNPYIGVRSRGSSNSMYNGSIDEVMIFNIGLSDAQILDIYNNQSSKFAVSGTQTINSINLSTDGTENRVNITLADCETNLGSNLSAQLGYGERVGGSYCFDDPGFGEYDCTDILEQAPCEEQGSPCLWDGSCNEDGGGANCGYFNSQTSCEGPNQADVCTWAYDYNGSITDFQNCEITNYEITGNPDDASLRLTLYAGNDTDPFYSPIVIGNITLESWYEEEGIASCQSLDQANTIYTQTADITQDADDTCINITAENITFNGNGFSITSVFNQSGVYSNQFNTTIQNCNISMGSGSGGYGINLRNANNSLVYNNTLNNQQVGLSLLSSNTTVENNTANSNTYGIGLSAAFDNNIISNTVNSNTNGIYLISGSSSNQITNNTADSNTIGISLESSSNSNQITDNTADSNSRGIDINSGLYNNITDNIANSNTYGIYLTSSSINNLINNTANSNGYGILLSSSSSSNYIINNTLNLNSDGIRLESSSNSNTFTSNIILNSTIGASIYIDESDWNVFDSNKIDNSSADPIWGGGYGVHIVSSGSGVNDNSDSNTFKNTNMTNIESTSVVIEDDGSDSENLGNIFLNFSYHNESVGLRSELIRKWYYIAYVNDTAGLNVDEANVTAFNVSGDYNFNLTTDSTGYTPLEEITDYVNNGTITYYSLYNITAINDSYFLNSHDYNATLQESNYEDVFTLGGTEIYSCQTLDQANTVYTQQADIVQTADEDTTCIVISAENITFNGNGYSIIGSLSLSGIYSNQLNTTIQNCNISMGGGYLGLGIFLSFANDSYIYNNTLNNQTGGIFLSNTNNIIIENNTVNSNNDYGISLSYSYNSNITNNNISLNIKHGLSTTFSDSNNIIGNILYKNGNNSGDYKDGIQLSSSNFNIVNGNNISENYDDGLSLKLGCSGNTISDNIIFNNANKGILVGDSSNSNTFSSNNISSNLDDGMKFESSSNNTAKDSIIFGSGDKDVSLDTTSLNNTFLNTTYNPSKEYVEAGSELIRKWYYKAMATDGSNNVADVNIIAYNVSNAEEFSILTDDTGYTSESEITDYMNNGTDIIYASLYNVTSTGTGNVSFIISSHEYNATLNESEYQDILILGLNETPRVCGIMRNVDTIYAVSNNVKANDTCFYIQENNITIDLNGFNLSGDSKATYGIFSDGYSNLTIKNGNINDTAVGEGAGIYLANGENNNITGITTSSNTLGIYLINSSDNFITNNNASSGSYGMQIDSSDNNIISDNIASYGSDVGIRILYSLNNTIQNNDVSHNYDYDSDGIYLENSNYTTIIGNTVVNNTQHGIYLSNYSSNNNISDGNFSLNMNILLNQNSANNIFLNISYEISNESVEEGSELIRKWYYTAFVNDTQGNSQGSVNVTAFNDSGDFQFNLTTDTTTGLTELGEIVQYINNGTDVSHQGFYTVYAGNNSYPTINKSYNASEQDNNYDGDGFNFSQSAIELSQGWNLISFGMHTEEDSTDRTINITSTGTDNLIGYSSNLSLFIEMVNFTNESNWMGNWSEAVAEGKVQAYMKYFVNGTAKYVAAEELEMDTTNLSYQTGYIIQVNEDGNLTFTGAGGSIFNDTELNPFSFDKLMVYSGDENEEANITDADNSTNNWIFATDRSYFYYRDGIGWGKVCGDGLSCDDTFLYPWKSYYMWVNNATVTMYRRNY